MHRSPSSFIVQSRPQAADFHSAVERSVNLYPHPLSFIWSTRAVRNPSSLFSLPSAIVLLLSIPVKGRAPSEGQTCGPGEKSHRSHRSLSAPFCPTHCWVFVSLASLVSVDAILVVPRHLHSFPSAFSFPFKVFLMQTISSLSALYPCLQTPSIPSLSVNRC